MKIFIASTLAADDPIMRRIRQLQYRREHLFDLVTYPYDGSDPDWKAQSERLIRRCDVFLLFISQSLGARTPTGSCIGVEQYLIALESGVPHRPVYALDDEWVYDSRPDDARDFQELEGIVGGGRGEPASAINYVTDSAYALEHLFSWLVRLASPDTGFLFVSSTRHDNDRVRDSLAGKSVFGYPVYRFEDLPHGLCPKTTSVFLARHCRVFIALISPWPGTKDPDTGATYCEIEYRVARRRRKPGFAIRREGHRRQDYPKHEHDTERVQKLNRLIAENFAPVYTYRDEKEFFSAIFDGVSQLRTREKDLVP